MADAVARPFQQPLEGDGLRPAILDQENLAHGIFACMLARSASEGVHGVPPWRCGLSARLAAFNSLPCRGIPQKRDDASSGTTGTLPACLNSSKPLAPSSPMP